MPDTEKVIAYKTITKRTRDLLNSGEGLSVDYKRDVRAIEAGDLVAFANSDNGGFILAGVDEFNDENGFQKGLVVGCAVGDEEKLIILNKANSTRPPVEVEVVVENSSNKPFYRIEIPSGHYKPYCTAKGEYLIRSDGRNIALLPEKLLSIFLEVQGKDFIERFKKATEKLEEQLTSTQNKLLNIDRAIDYLSGAVNDKIESLLSNVDYMARIIDSQLNGIYESAENADSLADEAMNYSMEAVGEIQEVSEKIGLIEEFVYTINERVISVLQNFNIEDPIIMRIRDNVKSYAKDLYEANQSKQKVHNKIKNRFSHMGKELLSRWVKEAFEEFTEEKLSNKI